MKTRNLKGMVALGSLTATVALLAGLSSASAQAPTAAPGAGSFPQSFLIPGTNTSISIYGIIKAVWYQNIGQHLGNTQTTGTSVPFAISQLALHGPGVGTSPLNTSTEQSALKNGLDAFGKASTFTFETRTPSDLGEIKTVLSYDASLMSNQAEYQNIGGTNYNTKPNEGSGNTPAVRLLWAYGTIGPWLIGQYNTAWADALLFPDQIGDPGFSPGLMTTANVRQSQIRYTYLAGNGLSLSASVEQDESGTLYIQKTTTPGTAAVPYAGGVSSMVTDNTDIGGINNYPDLNVGFAWDQPWGHVMGRVGVAENQIRNSVQQLNIFRADGTPGNSISKTGFAVEAGGYINTWGQDQLKALVSYDQGIANFDSDLSGTSGGNMFCNGYTGACDLISDTTFYVDYVHRFSPNWRVAGDFGIGWFSKPSSAAGLTSLGTAGSTSNAQLASLEKQHWDTHLWAIWSPVPGLTDIGLGWDHWDRQVQAFRTGGSSNEVKLSMYFYW